VIDARSRRVLILTPAGRDAAIACDLLSEVGVDCHICSGLPALVSELKLGAGSAIVAEEALRSANITELAGWLQDQPPWSDFPIILLSQHGGGPERNPAARRWAEVLGNVTVIERPFHPTTLTAVVSSAARSRFRQYEARTRAEELASERSALADLNATLEERVVQRTNELMSEVAARERAQEQLRQAQKMESIGQLTGGIAHDFNNLLMVVMSALVLLKRRLPETPQTTQLIEGALQAAERGASLTQRLLAFARQQDLQTSAVDLRGLVTGMSDLLHRSLGPRFEVVIDATADLPPAQVDANQLELAVLNLAINARDSMADGGTITISIQEEAVLNHPTVRSGRFLAIRVADSGTGMDNETLKRAIEPFFSTKAVGKGTGLGLSMVHGLADQLGGGFVLESEPGVGTVATIYVPQASHGAEAALSTTAAGPDATNGVRVLVVDDDHLVASLTAGMLEELGHSVVEVHSGAAALKILEQDEHIDVLMTDYLMPGMTGVEVVRAAQALRPGLQVLIATGFAEVSDGVPSDIPRISKPYDLDTLRTRLATLTGDRPAS
jgi:signal transduction histidine kinase